MLLDTVVALDTVGEEVGGRRLQQRTNTGITNTAVFGGITNTDA